MSRVIKWARENSGMYSVQGSSITVDRLAILRLLERIDSLEAKQEQLLKDWREQLRTAQDPYNE